MNILIAFGTRPEVIKLAPVIRELRGHPGFDVKVLHSGQHSDLAQSAIEELKIEVDYRFYLTRQSSSLSALGSAVLKECDALFSNNNFDLVIIHGDTSTTALIGLAAFYQKVPVAHVEAGLRSFDLSSPFPEELNRRIAGLVARFHFAPTVPAVENLKSEGIPEKNICLTGNTGIDSLLWADKLNERVEKTTVEDSDGVLRNIEPEQKIVFVTLHRRENAGDPIQNIIRRLSETYQQSKDVLFVIPLHPNQSIPQGLLVELSLKKLNNFIFTRPLSYLKTVEILKRSVVVLTDSGGLQEEAVTLGTDVIVARDKTERPEGLSTGLMHIAGVDPTRILVLLDKILRTPKLEKKQQAVYGDGQAAKRVTNFLATNLLPLKCRSTDRL